MIEFSFDLPWPAMALWPNTRAHWFYTNREFQVAKNFAFFVAREQGVTAYEKRPSEIALRLTFYNGKRRYDLDNALAASKAYIDGIAAALTIDDRYFQFLIARGTLKQKLVRVELYIEDYIPD